MYPAAAASFRKLPESFVSKLAQFFPNATPVRIPVSLTRVNLGGGQFSESTVIEFGTNREVLFLSSQPLEFADRLHLQNPDGTLDIDALWWRCSMIVAKQRWRHAFSKMFPTGS